MRASIILALGISMITGALLVEAGASRARQRVGRQPSEQIANLETRQSYDLRLRVETNQLAQEDGVVPVELKCADAELSKPSVLEKLSCVLTNNTDKPISAGAIYISLNIEKDGVMSISSNYQTFDTFLHLDSRNKNNLVLPGEEYPLNKLPVSFESNVAIKGAIVGVDFIEFNDHTSLGPNQAGSRIISDTRGGAAKYKEWLVRRYEQTGQSLDAVIPLLDANQPLPQELKFQTGPEESGARMYRNSVRRTYKLEGSEGLSKQLKKSEAH